jgi:hypothetical protein
MQDEAVTRESRWRLPFTWLGLVALAWLLYELTREPALGAVAVCLKFGWEDFLTARWLWRNDPELWRRRATFWLYLSWGLWKTAVVAFLMSIGFAFVATRLGVPAAPAMPPALVGFLGTIITTLASFGLSTLTTLLAVLCAWRGGAWLWLDSAVHRARRLDVWPPSPLCEGRTNRLSQLIMSALGLSMFVVLILLLATGPIWGVSFILCFALSITAPVTLLLFRDLVLDNVSADSPEECWPDEWEEHEEPWQEDLAT